MYYIIFIIIHLSINPIPEADKVNSGLEVAMVVDDDVTGDQNENNEYENERREGKRKVKKEEQNLLKRGIPKEVYVFRVRDRVKVKVRVRVVVRGLGIKLWLGLLPRNKTL